MEEFQVCGACDPSDGDGLENQPGSFVSVKGTDNQAGCTGPVSILFAEIGIAEYQAGCPGFNRQVCDILLISAQDNGIRINSVGTAWKGS